MNIFTARRIPCVRGTVPRMQEMRRAVRAATRCPSIRQVIVFSFS